MNKKVIFILFAAIFYNDVSYSLPTGDQQLADVKTAVPVHEQINTTVVTLPKTAVNQSVNAEAVVTHLPPTNSTVKPTVIPSVVVKNETLPTATNKTVPDVVPKNMTVIDNKNSSQVVINTNSSVPVPSQNNTNTSVVPNANSSNGTLPIPITPASNNSSNTSSTLAPEPTTMKPTTVSSTTEMNDKKTTVAPAVVTTTQSSVDAHNTFAPAQGNHFDGASFIGGMVLTIGLTAIGFIAFKFYKSGKIDMNYRTL